MKRLKCYNNIKIFLKLRIVIFECLCVDNVYVCVCVCVCVCESLSHVRFCGPMDHQAPLSKGFSGQEYWSGLPFPSPGESSRPRDQTYISCTEGGFFSVWATREAPQFSDIIKIPLLLGRKLRHTDPPPQASICMSKV